jgi:hypothetical protein
MALFSAAKVFSATMLRDREALGDRVTAWLRAHPELKVVDRVVNQSSDEGFHCISITLFLTGDPAAYLAEALPPPRPSNPR